MHLPNGNRIFCHSPGHLRLSEVAIEFIPGTVSLLGKHLTIAIESVDSVKSGDNFLWRGVVHIALKRPMDNRSKYTFFLGGKRESLISAFDNLRKSFDSEVRTDKTDM